jgi:hypothetical protein
MSARPILAAVCIVGIFSGPTVAGEGRRVVCLDGNWEIAQGPMDRVLANFGHHVPVPGLADMARPAFALVGQKPVEPGQQAFWYRRTFAIQGPVPAIATLKVHKAAFGTRVFLNGQLVGDHQPCFTPGLFDVRKSLKGNGQTNELVIRVGAWRDAVGKELPDGFDFEKIRYLPGIYDTVELILSNTPDLVRVQAVPELAARCVRAVAVLHNGGPTADAQLTAQVREVVSNKIVGSARSGPLHLAAGQQQTVDLRIPIEGCRLWSPEDPFLYRLELSTATDSLSARFGMRSFHFDPKTKMALLNGHSYPLRGTNVCIYRFFEDPTRGDRPWREDWVRRLHRVFHDMHWNSMRYCIGFPPEQWYRVADEEGLMIQDEFPIWYGGNRWPPELKSEELVREYTEWMQERWNHPSVVIWDAQNETVTKETGKAVAAVRGLDLSDRPWDNGYALPGKPTDTFEAHPYLAGGASFRLANLAQMTGEVGQPKTPQGSARPNEGHNPVIINEYGWMWLNRDGTATTLSKKVYERLLGPDSTAAQRRRTYARWLAAKTEFWRSHRHVAGVLHFCGLGYSRPDGQTSDHFLNIEKLTLDPDFQTYVGDAFAPVGLMIDFWADEVSAGERRAVPVAVINDLDRDWQGTVRLRMLCGETTLFEQSLPCRVAPVGRTVVDFAIRSPSAPGDYQLVAELIAAGEKPVRSLRDFSVLTDAQRKARAGLAQGRPVMASSSIRRHGATSPEAAVDGDPLTRWSSEFADPQWLAVDLGEVRKVARVELTWEGAYAKSYAIEVSLDGQTWKRVFATTSGKGGLDIVRFRPTDARWVRMYGTERGTRFGYSLWEFRVFP